MALHVSNPHLVLQQARQRARSQTQIPSSTTPQHSDLAFRSPLPERPPRRNPGQLGLIGGRPILPNKLIEEDAKTAQDSKNLSVAPTSTRPLKIVKCPARKDLALSENPPLDFLKVPASNDRTKAVHLQDVYNRSRTKSAENLTPTRLQKKSGTPKSHRTISEKDLNLPYASPSFHSRARSVELDLSKKSPRHRHQSTSASIFVSTKLKIVSPTTPNQKSNTTHSYSKATLSPKAQIPTRSPSHLKSSSLGVRMLPSSFASISPPRSTRLTATTMSPTHRPHSTTSFRTPTFSQSTRPSCRSIFQSLVTSASGQDISSSDITTQNNKPRGNARRASEKPQSSMPKYKRHAIYTHSLNFGAEFSSLGGVDTTMPLSDGHDSGFTLPSKRETLPVSFSSSLRHKNDIVDSIAEERITEEKDPESQANATEPSFLSSSSSVLGLGPSVNVSALLVKADGFGDMESSFLQRQSSRSGSGSSNSCSLHSLCSQEALSVSVALSKPVSQDANANAAVASSLAHHPIALELLMLLDVCIQEWSGPGAL
ncbi:hypothetical protein D9758_007184 [Tetrapyrgos nigripes]|uniref:Uncharacterized protein n=1 Tax=Tetrapyrgos nigripes TaxID=182062 RepID=A0A8H5D1J5_9AGAR|nr:hypothetical protein D9758_007184 [Tetrapyrgos nigripes]